MSGHFCNQNVVDRFQFHHVEILFNARPDYLETQVNLELEDNDDDDSDEDVDMDFSKKLIERNLKDMTEPELPPVNVDALSLSSLMMHGFDESSTHFITSH